MQIPNPLWKISAILTMSMWRIKRFHMRVQDAMVKKWTFGWYGHFPSFFSMVKTILQWDVKRDMKWGIQKNTLENSNKESMDLWCVEVSDGRKMERYFRNIWSAVQDRPSWSKGLTSNEMRWMPRSTSLKPNALVPPIVEPRHEKTCSCHMRTTDQRLCCSLPR